MSNKNCPECGRDDFKSNRGMRSHHARAHGESLSKKTVECDFCGESFKCKHTEDRRFCSQDCVHSWQSENWKNDALCNVGHKPKVIKRDSSSVTYECINCGDESNVSKYQFEEQGSKYCSTECRWEFQRTEKIKVECSGCGNDFEVSSESEKERRSFCSRECQWSEDGYGSAEKKSVCDNCGDEFWRDEYELGRRDGNTYCTHSCSMEHRKKERVTCECKECGEDFKLLESELNAGEKKGTFCSKSCKYENSRTAGGLKYGKGWSSTKREVRSRDNYRCQACGITQDQTKEVFGERLHVHHVVPFRLSEDNSKSNLISLCGCCHRRLEGKTHRE